MIRTGGMESFYSEPDLFREAIERQTYSKIIWFPLFLHLLGEVRLDLSIRGQTLPWCWWHTDRLCLLPTEAGNGEWVTSQALDSRVLVNPPKPNRWLQKHFPLRIQAIPSLRDTGDWLIVNVLTYLVLIFPRSISSPGKRRIEFWSMRSNTVIMASRKWQVIETLIHTFGKYRKDCDRCKSWSCTVRKPAKNFREMHFIMCMIYMHFYDIYTIKL